MALTADGEIFLGYARRLLKLNDEAFSRFLSPCCEGSVRLGVPNDNGVVAMPEILRRFARTHPKVEAFVGRCEDRLTPLLRSGELPGADLTQAIATAKVKAVETSIDLCWRLKQEVGSYALMGSSGFKHLDFLNCCKFAEGDSRVLMQKMARDRLRQFAKERKAQRTPPASHAAEVELCARLGAAMAAAKGDKALELVLWDDNWQTVYALAEATLSLIHI